MIKRLSACIRDYKRDTILTPIFTTLEVIMEVLIPLLMAKLIDKGIEASDLKWIWVYGGALFAAAVISLVVGTLAGSYAAKASAGFARNLRHDLYYSVQDFSFSNIDRFSTASIVNRCTTDVTNLQNAFQMIIRIAVRCPVMLIFSVAVTFYINARLAWVFVAAIPVLGVGLALIMTRAHPMFKRVFNTYDKLNSVVQEDLRGIRVVKSFVREDHERERFGVISKSIYDDFSGAEKLLAFNMPLMQLCVYGCMLLISWMGAKMIVGGTMTTGELTSMFSYVMSILISLMMLSMVFVMIVMSRTSAERIYAVLTEQPDIHDPAQPVMEVKDGSVKFDHVSFAYSSRAEKRALDQVDLTIPSGQTVGIIGGTGAAKSTLVQLIPRLYDVTAGSVQVGGVDVRDYDLKVLRDQVAMVLQKNVLFSGTIKENLRWGDENATDEELERVCRLAQADEFIKTFPDGYDTYIEEGGANVSGGQKQRLCIARALLKKPKILILDDSTSAVDTRTDALIRRAFATEIPDTTKIIIAQRISSVQDADQIVVMDNGGIADVGTHEELLARNAIYQEVYRSQMKGGEDHE